MGAAARRIESHSLIIVGSKCFGTVRAMLDRHLSFALWEFSKLAHSPPLGDISMLQLALTLLILAILAAVLGFGGIAGSLAGIAKICFFVFLVLFLVSAISSALRGRTPV